MPDLTIDGVTVTSLTYPAAILNMLYPVGTLYESTSIATPAAMTAQFPGTTWQAYGAGRVLLGVDGTHTIGYTGGAETVTLTDNEMPAHTHSQSSHTHTLSDPGHVHRYTIPEVNYAYSIGANGACTTDRSNSYNTASSQTGISIAATTPPGIGVNGGGAAHDNMPPYVTVYRYVRTA